MIARVYILRGKKNFERVQAKGRMVQSDTFGISILDRGDTQNSRFGFVVSTKISKESVQRNRIKRALSEAVRYLMTEIKNGYDVVFLVKQSSLRKSTADIMREVQVALEKGGIFK